MKRKLIFYISIVMMLLFVGATTVYAYFETNPVVSTELTYSATAASSVEINNYSEFYEYTNYYSAVAKKFNSKDKISAASDRFTMNVNSDISLMNDITITSDCNINIAEGKRINLNGYKLIIKNVFDGAMNISGDPNSITDVTLTDEGIKNNIYIDCPYSAVIFSDNLIDETKVEKIVINENPNVVINSAFKFVFANIQNVGINDFYTTTLDLERISSHNCSFSDTHSENSCGCLYTYTDLEFIYDYLSYDIKIEYISGNTDVLSNNGNVEIVDQSILVPLTIKITYNDVSLEQTIDVHIVSENDYDLASLNVMNEYLFRYYNHEELQYQFDGPIILPSYDSYFLQAYNYELSSNDGNFVESTTDSELNDDYFEVVNSGDNPNNSYYITYIDVRVEKLTISTSNNSITLPVKLLAAETEEDNASYAAGFMVDTYGSQIEITEDSAGYSGYSQEYLVTKPDIKYERIKSVSYAIVNDPDNTYEIVSGKVENGIEYDLLRVNSLSSVKPNVTQTVFLEATFEFYEGDNPVLQTSIVYIHVDNDEDEFTFDEFVQYYTYFNREFTLSSNNYTYDDFEIPFTFGTSLPAFTFKVYEKVFNENIDDYIYQESNNGLFTFILKYNIDGVEHEYNIDNLIKTGSNPGDIINEAASLGTARLVVDINPYYVNKDTTEYKFIYVPIYTSGNLAHYVWDDQSTGSKNYTTLYPDGNNEWVHIVPTGEYVMENDILKYDYISELTVPGLVRYQCSSSVGAQFSGGNYVKPTYTTLATYPLTEEFVDYNLYRLIYDKIYDANTYVEGVTFIETDRLNEVTEIVLATNTYESLRGIQLLKNVKVLNLSNFYLVAGTGRYYTGGTNGIYYLTHQISNIDEITYLSEMTALEELYIQNAGIQDYAMANTALPSGNSNGLLKILSNLINLKILDVSNTSNSSANMNRIYEFAELEGFASLQKVTVSNNIFDANFTLLGGLIDLSGIFETISNSIYGSGGAVNAGVFAILKSNGIEVVNTDTTSNDPNIIKISYVLVNFEHQDKIPAGVDLTSIISQYVSSNNHTKSEVLNYYGLIDPLPLGDYDFDFNGIYFTNQEEVSNSNGGNSMITYQDRFFISIDYDYSITSWGQTAEGTIHFKYTYYVTRY